MGTVSVKLTRLFRAVNPQVMGGVSKDGVMKGTKRLDEVIATKHPIQVLRVSLQESFAKWKE